MTANRIATLPFSPEVMNHSRNRCATWDQAEAMHAEAVQLVRVDHLRVVK